jgi:hypothetical protein
MKHQDAYSLSGFLYYLNSARSEIIDPFPEAKGNFLARIADGPVAEVN